MNSCNLRVRVNFAIFAIAIATFICTTTSVQAAEKRIETQKQFDSQGVKSGRTEEIADITGTASIIEQITRTQDALKESNLSHAELAEFKQRLLYQRVRLNHLMLRANLQVNSIRAAVDQAMAEVDDAQALIMEKRARSLKRNSMINLVSGGVTKIVGYSIALSPISAIPTNILEIFDGGVQSGLSGLTLKEDRDERQFATTMPSIIMTLINGNNESNSNFPKLVWDYLNRARSLTNKQTRREILLEKWTNSGMLERHNKATLSSNNRITPYQLLDDRAAMLADLKSMVSRMHNDLMELEERIEQTFQLDPIY